MFFQNPFCICFSFNNLGASRGFAFVEFNTIDEAAHWMELTQVPTSHNNQANNGKVYTTEQRDRDSPRDQLSSYMLLIHTQKQHTQYKEANTFSH